MGNKSEGKAMGYEFADRLIELRRREGLSQEELATKLGVSRQAISKWERAESSPDVGNLIALSKVYGITIDELVNGTATEAEADQSEQVQTVAEPVSIDEEASVVEAVAVEPEPTATVQEPTPTVPESPFVTPEPIYEAPEPVQATPEPMYPAPDPTTRVDGWVSPTTAQGQYAESYRRMAESERLRAERKRHSLRTFPYPIVVAIAYLFFGFVFNLWHPMWVLFLTIPFYYWIVRCISHDPYFQDDLH